MRVCWRSLISENTSPFPTKNISKDEFLETRWVYIADCFFLTLISCYKVPQIQI